MEPPYILFKVLISGMIARAEDLDSRITWTLFVAVDLNLANKYREDLSIGAILKAREVLQGWRAAEIVVVSVERLDGQLVLFKAQEE